jgi:hypothetical protein
MRIVSPLTALFLFSSAAAGCSSEPPPPPPCEPDLATFEADVRPRIERYCGSCHGATPDFGAPLGLLDHARLVAERAPGETVADRVAARIVDGTMPPIGMPRMPDVDAEAIADWASCGAADVPAATGLQVDAPLFLSPEDAPGGLETLDLLANEHPVGIDEVDRYQCFAFDIAIDAPRFIRRFEMVYDDTRVLHHLVVMRDPERGSTPGSFECEGGNGMPPGSQFVYAWAPGLGPTQFPDGGLRVTPGSRYIVQLHYNNGARVPDVRDSSGVRLFLGPVEGTEYGLIAIGPLDFSIPARGTATASSRCTFPVETRVLATWPHMHTTGSSFVEDIERASGGRERHIELHGWDFESQLLYSTPRVLQPGDAITTSCTFVNPGAEEVRAGTGTADEMCFGFLYVTPPLADRFCDEGSTEMPSDIRYVAGSCAPEGAPTDVPLVRGAWEERAEPPVLSAGELPDARWALESLTYYVSRGTTPLGEIDFERTYVLGRGQVWTDGGELTMDLDTHTVVISVEGLTFGGPNESSFRGEFAATGTSATIELGCPEGGDQLDVDWGVDGDTLTIGFESDDVPSATLWPRYTFRRVP